MKLLHVSTALSWRGGEQQLTYLANELHGKDIQQIVLCPEGAPLAERLMEDGLLVSTFKTRGVLDIFLARAIHRICQRESIDIIHCHDSHAHSGAVVASFLFGNSTPIVVNRRINFPVSGNFLSKWKYNHPSVRKIICVSEAIRKITAPSIRNPAVLTVIHSGIDPARYPEGKEYPKLLDELKLSGSNLLVGNLSALDKTKDYPTFLKTAAIVVQKNPDIHFVIAGKGKEERHIRQLIRQLNLEDRVHLLGFRTDVVAVMKSLDVFLITSVIEGLGTIVLEAFAAGTPVVATRTGGIPEMVDDGVTGLTAPAQDPVQLAECVLRITADPALRDRLTMHAAQRLQQFTYRETARKTLIVYQQILGKTGN